MAKHYDEDGDNIADSDWRPAGDWSPCEDRNDPATWGDPTIDDEPAQRNNSLHFYGGTFHGPVGA